MSRIALDPHEPLSQLRALEAESVHVMREVAAEFDRPVLLFSGGKDSIVLLRLAEKAFRPGPFPFPVMHVDTGHNFAEVLEFRDRRLDELGERLVVASVQDSIDNGRAREETGRDASRNRLQTVTLLDAIEEHGFDAAFGGARRDEERARAKERVLSFRDDFGQWDPRAQRPEVWGLYNTRIHRGEHVRVFPLSNWTELDVWRYIEAEGLELPSIYFAHPRTVFERDGLLLATSEHLAPRDGETTFEASVRYRTVGDLTVTGAVRSEAADLESAALEQRLVDAGRAAYLLDGDNVRHGLSGDLGFDDADRAENIRRVAHVARLFADSGTVALVSLVSPAAADRALARRLHDAAGLPFLEVHVDTPLAECERRDPKGLYARARAGELPGLTGVDAPYEAPDSPELTVDGAEEPVERSVERLLEALPMAH